MMIGQVDGLVDFYEQHVPVKARVSNNEGSNSCGWAQGLHSTI